MQGDFHLIILSKVADMKSIYTFEKRAFLNPASTHSNSYIEAHIESGVEAPFKYGDNMITIADCKRVIQLEFFLGNARSRRLSLKKINLLIDILTSFRDALANEIGLIEKSK